MTGNAKNTPIKSSAFVRVLRSFSIPEDAVKLSAETAVYGIGKFGEGLAALVLIPVLTRAFAPAEYGMWDVTMTFFLLTTMVASLGLEPALAAFYFETREADRKKLVASTSILFRLLSSIVAAVLIVAFAPQISMIIFGSVRQTPYFRIVGVALPFFLAGNIFKLLLRLDFAPAKFNIVGVGYAALFAALAIVLVVNMKMGVSGVLLGILASAICFSVVGGIFTARHFSLRFSAQLLKDMLRFSLPLLPSLFAIWIIDFSDRYFLTRMSTLGQVGIYSVGARISSIIILFSASFQMAWGPFALSIQHEDDAKEKYSRGLFLFVCALLACATAITIFARPILVLLTEPLYYDAEKVIGPLALATVAYGAFLVVNIGLILKKKTLLTSAAISVGAALNLGLNFFLIPRFDIMGAAVATAVSFFVAFLLLYFFAQRHYPIDYKLSRIVGLTLLSICVMAVSSVVRFNSMAVVDFLFRMLLFAGFLFYLLRVCLLRPKKS